MKPPNELQAAGRRLWSAILVDLDDRMELTARECELLRLAALQADLAAALEAALAGEELVTLGSRGQTRVTPIVDKLQAARMAQARLLGQLDLPDGGRSQSRAPAGSPSAGSNRAAAAARERWARRRGASSAA